MAVGKRGNVKARRCGCEQVVTHTAYSSERDVIDAALGDYILLVVDHQISEISGEVCAVVLGVEGHVIYILGRCEHGCGKSRHIEDGVVIIEQVYAVVIIHEEEIPLTGIVGGMLYYVAMQIIDSIIGYQFI